ncbi:IS110 family transposase [Arthrobacter sp. BB-1]|uniref:IS110 family transposase n=1 Tax=unclassified Arthrobacter TaxID=235627 RepID=UPI0010EFF4AD|nr:MULTISPECIES: IS110 family transposase [unclassified Arthrobacter]TNB67233.1 IS110 family transposase [Arthrobacter sp. BB-1]TNB67248.1 IS110 family transposase [Arthrobacter sp. BB-1]VII98716.1 Mobile element protein [Arthrobacter sp. DR-2P]
MFERTSVGLDVHARSVVACALDGLTGEVFRHRLTPDRDEILAWIISLPPPVKVVYEAGPTGFGLARFLGSAGIDTVVAAPSKLQRPSGDRVKTDAKDALHLARLLKLGEITAVQVPSVEQEAARDLVRSREDLRGDLMRSRHRISKLLLRQGIVYSGGQAWTAAHELWLARQHFDAPARQLTYESSLEAMHEISDRRDRLDQAITVMAYGSGYTPVVRALQCLRGISTLTAFGLAVEIGDWDRFTGSTIGAYLGLVPTEHSSGASRSQGSITKTGNSHARRLLVEAAWHHRRPYNTPSRLMRSRWEEANSEARIRGHAGNRRLHERWIKYLERRKRPVIANVAIARELSGWCWSLATGNPATRHSPI